MALPGIAVFGLLVGIVMVKEKAPGVTPGRNRAPGGLVDHLTIRGVRMGKLPGFVTVDGVAVPRRGTKN